MKTNSGLMTAGVVCAAVLLTSELSAAQSAETNGDASAAFPGPLVSFHGSTGRLDPRDANTQAIARETANALAGEIEEPVMTPTRSSFLAKWHAAAGATGYRLDVSTTPSFDSYVSGYKDRDIGNATNQIVSGLERGKQYYYRVRAYDAAGMGSDSSETTPATTANTTSGLVITPTFDSTITSDPRSNAIQAMIISTIQTYQTLFSDPITVAIRFRFSAVDANGKPMDNLVGASNTTIDGIDWNTYITALKADAKTANDMAAIATLPTSPLTAVIVSKSAGGRAIGLNTLPADFGFGGAYDGVITLNSSKPCQFTRPVSAGNADARMFTEHEIDEVLGLGSHLGSAQPQFLFAQDLFSWASLNARNTTATGERHFSIDRGLHFIVTFNQDPGGDYGDWESEPQCPQNHTLVQNAWNCYGQSAEISATSPEGINLDVVGYDLVTGNGGNGVLGNISTRLPVGSGDNILIAGFQITGSSSKQLVVRALGPSLAQFGLTNVLPDTTLELHDSTGAIIATNDDWQNGANSQSIPSALRPTNQLESAIFATLGRGAYTAVLRGYNNSTGIGLVEVYDTSIGSTQLGNISTRGFVQTGDNVMIAGLVVQSQNKQVVVRALGPTLTRFGINNALSDPTLSLYDRNGVLLISNDDWRDTQESIISSTGLAPSDDLESAIAGTLAPGSYTAIVRGFENATGNALVEVYGLN
ncbi:MAG TPA: fibronectin type III domain-containing protein [Chthoniobacterales bacterium]|nr:fibronectin type III domain-containing protein [Chthoniobacterales bacterium]